jgi:hypothetical protein
MSSIDDDFQDGNVVSDGCSSASSLWLLSLMMMKMAWLLKQ